MPPSSSVGKSTSLPYRTSRCPIHDLSESYRDGFPCVVRDSHVAWGWGFHATYHAAQHSRLCRGNALTVRPGQSVAVWRRQPQVQNRGYGLETKSSWMLIRMPRSISHTSSPRQFLLAVARRLFSPEIKHSTTPTITNPSPPS